MINIRTVGAKNFSPLQTTIFVIEKREMETAILNILLENIHLPAGISLAVLIELFKKFFVRLECGKYAFIFDKEHHLKLNLRLLIIGISVAFFAVILIIDGSLELLPELVITFFAANFFYEYFLKHIMKQLKIKN